MHAFEHLQLSELVERHVLAVLLVFVLDQEIHIPARAAVTEERVGFN